MYVPYVSVVLSGGTASTFTVVLGYVSNVCVCVSNVALYRNICAIGL